MQDNPRASAGTAPTLAPDWIASVMDFHRVAYSVVGQARYDAIERIGLMATSGGFGTPMFASAAGGTTDGAERCVCVIGDKICVSGTGTDGAADCLANPEPITTLRAAATFVGVAEPGTVAAEHDSPELGDIDRKLNVSAAVGETLGWWFALGDEVLAELFATPGALEPEEVTLWPGHFDIATAMGAPGSGELIGRASYGLSPGDHSHPEPYVYVGSWGEVDRSDSYWNDPNFAGASLPYQALAGVADPTAMVMEFLRTGYDKLTELASKAG